MESQRSSNDLGELACCCIDVHSDLLDEAQAGLYDRALSRMLQPFSSVDRQKLVARVQTLQSGNDDNVQLAQVTNCHSS